MFFLTFGLYSVAASLLLHYFDSSFAGNVSIFSGIVMALSSIPMFFSKDNISTALCSSWIGGILCESVNVRTVSLKKNEITGHKNQGFALGVIAGTLSIALSTRVILMAILMIFVCSAAFALPAVGIVFLAAGFPFFSGDIFAAVTIVTLLAYIIKVLRGKRSISFHISGVVFLTLFLYFAVRTAYSPMLTFGAWKFTVLLLPYFLAALILKNFRDAVKAPIIIALSCAAVSLLYCLSYGTFILTVYVFPGTGLDGAFFFDTLTSLDIFKNGSAPLIIASAIPLSAGVALRSDHRLPRAILWGCIAADTAFIALTDDYARLLSVVAAAVIAVLLLYGRKWGYISLLAACAAAAAFIYVGGFSGRFISYYRTAFADFTAQIREFFEFFTSLPLKTVLLGSGDAAGEAGANFFSRFLLSFGFIGFSLFCIFFAAVAVISIEFFIRTSKAEKKRDLFERFAAVSRSSDTRLGAAAPLSGVLVILAGGLFTDVFGSDALYMLIWLYFGIWFAYRRSAQKEISKALASDLGNHSEHSAEIQLSFR